MSTRLLVFTPDYLTPPPCLGMKYGFLWSGNQEALGVMKEVRKGSYGEDDGGRRRESSGTTSHCRISDPDLLDPGPFGPCPTERKGLGRVPTLPGNRTSVLLRHKRAGSTTVDRRTSLESAGLRRQTETVRERHDSRT